MSERAIFPLKRESQVLVENVENEILIYDLENAQANCLNQTAALVWEYADGKSSASQIAKRVSAKLGAPVSEQVVWYALDQLNRKNLLQESVQLPTKYATMSRRDFMKRAAMVGAVVAIPAVVAIAAPKVAEAGSPCPPIPCLTPSECCPGQPCVMNVCQPF